MRLRPHHLLCVLTFAGEGYSAAFVANFRAIVERVEHGENVSLADGPDDICAALASNDDDHCSGESVRCRDREALTALEASGQLPHDRRSVRLDAQAVAALRRRFADGTLRAACGGCSWWSLCTGIASDRFGRALLFRP